MSSNTNEARHRQHGRLVRPVTRYSPSHQHAAALKYAAEKVLADNQVGPEGTTREIANSIRSLLLFLLLLPQTVFTPEYFSQSVFPVKLIKDVAALNGCLEIDHHILDEIETEKNADPVLMANKWLAHAYDPTMERVVMIIDMYEISRIYNSHVAV